MTPRHSSLAFLLYLNVPSFPKTDFPWLGTAVADWLYGSAGYSATNSHA